MKARLVELKKSDAAWLYEVSAHIGQHDSARLYGSNTKPIAFEGERHLHLPLIGRVRLKETLRERGFEGRIVSATIRRRADRWFVSLCVERDRAIVKPTPVRRATDVVGVDLGLKSVAVIHDGVTARVIEPQRALRKNLKKLRRLNRQIARKQKGSADREKAKRELARLHCRISCQREDHLHELSSSLARTKSVIVLEDLHVKGMQRNRSLALSISDAGFGELRRQLACDACGLILDRDENAAINLRRLGLSAMELPEGLRDVMPVERKALASALAVEVKPASLKQEASSSPRSRRATQRREERLAGAVTSGV